MKKKTLLFGLILVLNLSTFSQEFISTDKKWNVLSNGWAYSFNTEIFRIDGDSIVDNITYNKIWLSSDSLLTWWFQGLLREDSNIVYYVPPNSTEGILYDFNIDIGDSTFIKNFFCNYEELPLFVTDIDTVEHLGKSLKRWHLTADNNSIEYWIEGIGSLSGPLYSNYWNCIICPTWELLCYHNNDTLEYIMSGQTNCYQSTVGINDNYGQIENDFLIKPNPAKKGTDIYIETNSKPVNINIFNSVGLLIKTINPENNKSIRIETNTFESGLYFITIKTIDKRIKTKKIIIK
jgi:hypothetical protein